MSDELRLEIEKLRGELGAKEAELKLYVVEKANAARAQAIGILAVIATLGGLGLWASITPIVRGAGVGKAVRVAEEAQAEAEAAARKANEIAADLPSIPSDLTQLRNEVDGLAVILAPGSCPSPWVKVADTIFPVWHSNDISRIGVSTPFKFNENWPYISASICVR